MTAWPRGLAVETERIGWPQVIYIWKQTGLPEKSAERDEEKKGIKDSFHV